MTDKNKKKKEAKKRRNFWPLNPVTRVKQSKKIYSRKGNKDDRNKN